MTVRSLKGQGVKEQGCEGSHKAGALSQGVREGAISTRNKMAANWKSRVQQGPGGKDFWGRNWLITNQESQPVESVEF